jgi:hypothetical protein
MKWGGWLLLLWAAAVQAAETGTVLKACELKQKPFSDAAKVADLGEKSPVEILARQGAWMQIKTNDGATGWVKLLSVRTGSGETKSGGGTVLSGLFKTGSSAGSTTGVKGINEEDLINPHPNPTEFAKLDGFTVSQDDAAKFAKAAKLVANADIAYLPKSDKSR